MKERRTVGIYSLINPTGYCAHSEKIMSKFDNVVDCDFQPGVIHTTDDISYQLETLLKKSKPSSGSVVARLQREYDCIELLKALDLFHTVYLIHNGNGDDRLFIQDAVERGFDSLIQKTILMEKKDPEQPASAEPEPGKIQSYDCSGQFEFHYRWDCLICGTQNNDSTWITREDFGLPLMEAYVSCCCNDKEVTVVLWDKREKEVMPEKRCQQTIEHEIYQKLVDLFPSAMNREFDYLQLKAGKAMMALFVEWVSANRLSVMHCYSQNGDMMYDPMMVFEVDGENKKATAVEFEQSNPPLYQLIGEDGAGQSIDGNGIEKTIIDLQNKLNDFASQWFTNIREQNYLLERGEKNGWQ